MDDSFRGTCLKCGGPIREGNIHKECAQLELRSTQSFGDANRMVGQRQFTRTEFPPQPKAIARISDMANVQVCERCGSIGQARDFVSIGAHNLNGDTLVFPQLITRRAYDRAEEESAEEEESYPQENFTICRGCREDLRAFLQNKDSAPRQAGPILPNPQRTLGSGDSAPQSAS